MIFSSIKGLSSGCAGNVDCVFVLLAHQGKPSTSPWIRRWPVFSMLIHVLCGLDWREYRLNMNRPIPTLPVSIDSQLTFSFKETDVTLLRQRHIDQRHRPSWRNRTTPMTCFTMTGNSSFSHSVRPTSKRTTPPTRAGDTFLLKNRGLPWNCLSTSPYSFLFSPHPRNLFLGRTT